MRILLKKVTDPSSKGPSGCTPFLVLVGNRYQKMVGILLENKAHFWIPDYNSQLLSILVSNGQAAVMMIVK